MCSSDLGATGAELQETSAETRIPQSAQNQMGRSLFTDATLVLAAPPVKRRLSAQNEVTMLSLQIPSKVKHSQPTKLFRHEIFHARSLLRVARARRLDGLSDAIKDNCLAECCGHLRSIHGH